MVRMLSSLLQAIDRADDRLDRWFSGGSVPVEVREQSSTWGTWQGDSGPTAVTQSSALKLLAVTGSVQLLTESIATLPVDVFRNNAAGRSEVTPPAWMREPVMGLTFTDWCTQVLTSLLLHGNAYLVVTRNVTGSILEVTPVDPQSVVVDRAGSMGGRKRYMVNGRPFTGEIVHIKGMMLPGSDVGLSPLEFANQSIQLGLSAQEYGINNFDGGLKMPGVIEYPGQVDPAKMGETARLWQRARRKGGHGLPGVLEGGGSFKAMGITNEAAQFLQTRQWQASEICSMVYLVDARELGIPITGSTLEYVTSESRMANLVRKGMLRWITRIEAAVSALLPNPQYMKFNVNGFMRGDSSERWDTYLKASQINATAAATGQRPVLLTDEMRDWEELDPLPGTPPEADAAIVDLTPADRSDEIIAEIRAMDRPVPVPVPQPITISVDARQEPPVVNMESPVVNVELDARQADQPAPVVNVTVEPSPVEERAPSVTVRRVERDDDGRIVRVIDEEQ